MKKFVDSIIQTIGGTPLVRLNGYDKAVERKARFMLK